MMFERWLLTSALLATVAPACSSGDDKKGNADGAKTATADKTDKTDKADAKAGEAKPASGDKKKVAKASKKGASAKDLKQTSGEKLAANKSKAQPQTAQLEGLGCGDDTEGLAWCGSETEVVFCAEGLWYVLDCEALEDHAFCGMDTETLTIDCYVDEDIGELVAAAVVEAMVVDAVLDDDPLDDDEYE